VGELLRVVKRSQAVESIVWDFCHANVSLARIRACLVGKMRFRQYAK
jgi:hypothetical protein